MPPFAPYLSSYIQCTFLAHGWSGNRCSKRLHVVRRINWHTFVDQHRNAIVSVELLETLTKILRTMFLSHFFVISVREYDCPAWSPVAPQ